MSVSGPFTGRNATRVVEPGYVELRVGASSEDIRQVLNLNLTVPRQTVGFDRILTPQRTVEDRPSR